MVLPSDLDSSGLEIPDFSQGEGVEALSFFLGDVVGIGGLVNDLVHGLEPNKLAIPLERLKMLHMAST